MTPIIHIIPVLRDNYCYVLEGSDKNCIIIDPGQVTPVESYIQQHGLNPVLILNTHHHADHVAGNAALKDRYRVPVTGPKAEFVMIPAITGGVAEGDIIEESGIKLSVIETPGHTSGHIVFYSEEGNLLFAGDTIFSMGCGRLFEGTAEDLYESFQKLKKLPAQTQIYCGHEYTQANALFASSVDPDNADIIARMKEVTKLRTNNMPSLPVSIETELKTNPFLRAKSAEEFAILRQRKDHF